MRYTITLLFSFFATVLTAQKCDLYPNKNYILAEYGVKSLTTYVIDLNTGKKELLVRFELDSNGCAYKCKERRDTPYGPQYFIFDQKGSIATGKQEFYSAQMLNDSTEQLINRTINTYDAKGRLSKEEVWFPAEGRIYRRITTYGSAEPDTINRLVVSFNDQNDTTSMVITRSNPSESFYQYLIKKDGVWKESQKRTSKTSADRMKQEHYSWDNGKLTSARKFVTTKNEKGFEETIEYDRNDKPVQKTVITDNRGSYTIYKWERGDWVYQFDEQMPYGLPHKDPEIHDVNVDEGENVNVPPQQPEKKTVNKEKYKTLSDKPPVEKITYRDPVRKDAVIMREVFTVDGLYREMELPLDKKKYVYEYEFFTK
ncbi:MAG: hypothetical protein Fur0041_22250 [Bacteroidia bacterium]